MQLIMLNDVAVKCKKKNYGRSHEGTTVHNSMAIMYY